ncbi:hypothetical protein [Variovorax terrae]|uniref:Uncharacterized protein n=1 Tax=Variovorax terrae TaxID=2923278 RepID=A0A9X1VT51_9BURK|nr:hypothetical protein [Variovorax terrae]MCJ0761594.1 hypothetical protein [Variovorax terrae]
MNPFSSSFALLHLDFEMQQGKDCLALQVVSDVTFQNSLTKRRQSIESLDDFSCEVHGGKLTKVKIVSTKVIGLCMVPMRATRLFISSYACLQHAVALAAWPWVRRPSGCWPGFRLSPPSSLIS